MQRVDAGVLGMKLVLLLVLALTGAAAFADGPHDTFGDTQGFTVPGFRARTSGSCGRRVCERCKVRCVQCLDGCCSACVTSESYTQRAARNICESVGGNPAPINKVREVLEPLKIETPVWAAEQSVTTGPLGIFQRVSGALVRPDGVAISANPNLKAPAVCEIN